MFGNQYLKQILILNSETKSLFLELFYYSDDRNFHENLYCNLIGRPRVTFEVSNFNESANVIKIYFCWFHFITHEFFYHVFQSTILSLFFSSEGSKTLRFIR